MRLASIERYGSPQKLALPLDTFALKEACYILAHPFDTFALEEACYIYITETSDPLRVGNEVSGYIARS
jgi:hypothetical protein